MTDKSEESPQDMDKPEFSNLWAYTDNKRRKIGFAYTIKNGSLCIKGDKLMDKTQLGKLLTQGYMYFRRIDNL